MQQFTKIQEMKDYLRPMQSAGQKIGLVPTMGYLHEGHLSLIRRAVQESDIAVVSIFVNPIQFGPSEDLAKYPHNLAKDLELIDKTGAAVVFTPDAVEMYGDNHLTFVHVEKITDILCGPFRPGHFQGVATVVNKLFNIVRPDKAYFGQKDGQQAMVIQKMVRDLNMDVTIITCPTVREADGLAMSSRNTYLNVAERSQAPVLYQVLTAAKDMIQGSITDGVLIKKQIKTMISSKPLANIEYISLVDASSFREISQVSGPVMIALAVKFGATRLIDNIIVEG
ncbi:MAG TPA: pantoate--beta-alanine ligase [Firmicutes bacterium]|jgi:pantoate--beta-alanine ligase|nr:pantoate--beta-alanine ligase [Bacillota bacterium]